LKQFKCFWIEVQTFMPRTLVEEQPFMKLVSGEELKLLDCSLSEVQILITRNNDGQIPLRAACNSISWKNNLAVVELLLDEGANLRGKDTHGNTMLHDACKSGQAEIIPILHDRGLKDFDDENNDGKTPLHLACENGFIDTVHEMMILLKRKKLNSSRDKEIFEKGKIHVIQMIMNQTSKKCGYYEYCLKLRGYSFFSSEKVARIVNQVLIGVDVEMNDKEKDVTMTVLSLASSIELTLTSPGKIHPQTHTNTQTKKHKQLNPLNNMLFSFPFFFFSLFHFSFQHFSFCVRCWFVVFHGSCWF